MPMPHARIGVRAWRSDLVKTEPNQKEPDVFSDLIALTAFGVSHVCAGVCETVPVAIVASSLSVSSEPRRLAAPPARRRQGRRSAGRCLTGLARAIQWRWLHAPPPPLIHRESRHGRLRERRLALASWRR